MIKQIELLKLLKLRKRKKEVEQEMNVLVAKIKEGVERVQKGRFSVEYSVHARKQPAWKDEVGMLADVLTDKYHQKQYANYVEDVLRDAPTTPVEKVGVRDSQTGALG